MMIKVWILGMHQHQEEEETANRNVYEKMTTIEDVILYYVVGTDALQTGHIR